MAKLTHDLAIGIVLASVHNLDAWFRSGPKAFSWCRGRPRSTLTTCWDTGGVGGTSRMRGGSIFSFFSFRSFLITTLDPT
jgi:hypothetical protein